jgi:hypothetical protein
MGAFNFSIPKGIVNKILAEFNFDNFIETGTYMGGTAFWAATKFKNVHTIEINPEYSKQAEATLNRPKNINFYIGNSKDVLPEIVKTLSGRSFFWLDGHWCGGDVYSDKCPIIDEIIAIGACKDAVIFIDDARCFMGSIHEWKETMPLIDEIFAKVKELFPNHVTTIHDDIIMIVPKEIRPVVNKDWEEKFIDRHSPVSVTRSKCLKWLLSLKFASRNYILLKKINYDQ